LFDTLKEFLLSALEKNSYQIVNILSFFSLSKKARESVMKNSFGALK